ncbi:NOC3 [Acanthosepion pharaonis]|uniref:NOC3-like protein n=1 Tax=Acanthosepion pharaonis TaxID=158019 RepID=A0A812CVL1_ACAPH|nr:NOC3 [Sepia pharaonis]
MAATSKTKNITKSKGKGKTSHVKINNKRMNKKKKKLNKKKIQNNEMEKVLVENEAEEIPLQEEDFEYFGSDQADLAFIKRVKHNFGIRQKKKTEFNEEAFYEKASRNSFYQEDDKVYKPLLPVKINNKLIPQVQEVAANKNIEIEEDECKKEDAQLEGVEHNVCAAEEMFEKKQKLADTKQKMALVALSIIENPQEKFSGLRQLRLILEDDDAELKVIVRKLGMVTLMEVFRDIIPSYKIRKLTDKELQQKTSKETKSLQNYEESLLVSYKHYLEYLWSVVSGAQQKTEYSDINQQDHKIMKEVAIQCLCELLINCHHFNFRKDLISFVVPCMNLFNKKGSETACEAIKQVFQSDKLGATTLEIVKAIENFIKIKKMQVRPSMLNTFLSLKIKEIETNPVAGKVEKEKRKRKMMNMSRGQKKREKQMEQLRQELLETKAYEDKKKKCEFNTLTIQHGLAKFAHFINIDYFGDLFSILNQLIASVELTTQQSLHCALTAFIILSGQGKVLNVDPIQFYKHVYANLVRVDAGSTNADLNIILECLEAMIFKRKKQLTKSRIMAFMKRLSTLCLHALPEIFYSSPWRCSKYCSYIMFENDYLSGSGAFMPELSDPEYCNASNTCLWELHLLKNHVCPNVSSFANHVIHQAPLAGTGKLPSHLAKLSAMELYEKFSAESTIFGNG